MSTSTVNLTFNFAIIVVAITALHFYSKAHEKVLTLEKAVAPIEHLSNARHDIETGNYDQGVYAIEKAIKAMKVIEHNADSNAIEHVEDAIKDLKLVETEIKNDSIVLNDLNKAFFNALNSLAYAGLRISEDKLEDGHKYRAMNMLSASFKEMITSLKFAEDEVLKVKEEKAISDVRDFLKKLKEADYKHNDYDKYHLQYDYINREVEELIYWVWS